MSKETYGKKAYALSLEGYNARQISEMLHMPYENVRATIQRYRRANGVNRDTAGRVVGTPKDDVLYEAQKDTTTFIESIPVEEGIDITPEWIMRHKGLNPEEWTVIAFTKNVWQQQTKDGNTIDLCQSKLVVRPKTTIGLSISDIDKWFEEHKPEKVDFKPIEYKSEGEILEIDVADLHCGLLSWRYETGSDYDLHICADKFLAGIDDIVKRASKKEFKQIYICTLGDILHVDNMSGTTTKGTVQQIDGRITKIINFAYDTVNTAIDMLRSLNVPIKYVYLCGNHDTAMGYCLARMLQMTNQDVEFDIEPNPQKAIHFGKCLVGLSHGDMPKSNKGKWIMYDYRREFGESDFIEEHSGHVHTEEAKQYNGILVRSVMAQCGNSYWEHQQGYRSQRGIQCFVWNEEKGLRESWYYYY